MLADALSGGERRAVVCGSESPLADVLSNIGIESPDIRTDAEMRDLLALLDEEEALIAEQSKVAPRKRPPRPKPEPSVRPHASASQEERKDLHDRWTQYAMVKSVLSKRLKERLFDEWARVKGDSMVAEQFKLGDHAKLVRSHASWKLVTPSVDIYIGDDAGFKKVLDCLYTRNGFDEFCALLRSEKQRTSWLREFAWLDPTHFRRDPRVDASLAKRAEMLESVSADSGTAFLTTSDTRPRRAQPAWTTLPPINRAPSVRPTVEEMRASAPPVLQTVPSGAKLPKLLDVAQRVQMAHRASVSFSNDQAPKMAKACLHARISARTHIPRMRRCAMCSIGTTARRRDVGAVGAGGAMTRSGAQVLPPLTVTLTDRVMQEGKLDKLRFRTHKDVGVWCECVWVLRALRLCARACARVCVRARVCECVEVRVCVCVVRACACESS